ncbi:hypothetical protein PV10_03030 [Exophiala mesophila]|uniref:Uncharacterized protein n=1 Tax=Exophiala mesophila TaxID=212818 RepID=A0A0D1X0Q8_EXOME|nr:uncharacterized protein PV10_03030 [Exophiala mesophila]KIV95365.1 hypothetical protein PV10_03030 [Exophiala mesophila]
MAHEQARVYSPHPQARYARDKYSSSQRIFEDTHKPRAHELSGANDAPSEADAQVLPRALGWIPSKPSQRSFPRLGRLVAIPQIQPDTLRSGPMPFYRAYAPDLSYHAITLEEFVGFLDNLTVARAPAAPFQILQLASMGIGFVPHHWTQAASAGIGVVAGAGTASVSAARSKLYLKQANEQYFGPRGLKVTLVKDEKFRLLTCEDPRSYPLAPVSVSSHITVAERRMKALENHIAPLTFDVPSPEPQTNVLDKLSARQVQNTIRKSQEKAIKQARKKNEPLKASTKETKDQKKALKEAANLKWVVVENI